MILVGHITGTHGIKGELKCYSDFEKKERVFEPHFPVYIKGNKHVITSARFHQNHYLITLDEIYDINQIEEFRNQDVFIKREDLGLEEGEYLLQELIGFQVYEQEIYLGEIQDIVYNKGGKLLKVKKEHSFYIPYQSYFIENICGEERKVLVHNTKGLW